VPKRSRKGHREADRILEAATVMLAREGIAGATLSAIAEEADVDKRMILYYFGSREALLAQVVKWLGERAAAEAGRALAEVSSVLGPGPVVDVGVDALWSASLREPALPVAYMALLCGNRDPDVRRALHELKETFLALFVEHVEALEAQGYRLTVDRDGFVRHSFTLLRGLVLEWAEDGESALLEQGLGYFKQFAASCFEMSDATPSEVPRKVQNSPHG
jgi:AcrR family transcriptional regulator